MVSEPATLSADANMRAAQNLLLEALADDAATYPALGGKFLTTLMSAPADHAVGSETNCHVAIELPTLVKVTPLVVETTVCTTNLPRRSTQNAWKN